jgi:hypothetical protein
MQNVVNTQQREAARQSQLLRNQNQAQATSQGAYGGSRQGIVEAERQRNLMQQQSDIQGQGLQQAFGAGQQQFNAEQAAYLQAQQANQQAGLTAQQANQSTNLQTGIQNLQSQQNAQAAQEASRQFGANLGLQGYGQSLQAAQTLGQLGQQQYQQDMGTIQAMSGMGAAEQAQTQNIINQAMQNYSTQQQYPLMQLGVMSNMLRGLPMQASTTQNYQAQPSMLSQAAGAVGTGLGLVQQYNKAFPNKEGGVIKMASGGITSGANQYELNAMYKKFSDAQLGKALDDPEAQREKQRRDALRGAMAAGGIVAFKKGKEVDEERTLTKEEEEKILRAIGVPETPKEAEPSSAERIKSIRQSYVGGQPKEEAMVMPIDKEGIVAAARKNVSPVPDASRTTPPPSAGISAANSPMLGNVNQLYSDVEAANLEAGRDMQGNKIGAEADPADVAIEEHIANLKKQQSPLQEVMNKSKADLVKSYQKEREDINLPDPANRERQLLEDRKTRGEESEKETARNNLIRFLTKWGTIPGSTMRGLIGAGSDLIDKMDVDEKHRQKFLNEMDDIESKINSSEYARRLGDEDRARKEKDEAGKLYYKLASDITEIRLKEALKDKDVRKAIEVEKYKIKREEAKGPKGQEYMVGVYSRALTAGNPTKYPPGPSTDGIAAQMYMRDQPGVQSTAMTLSSREASAGADVTRATTAVTEAATKAKKDARDAVIALDKAVRNKTMTDETISRDIDAANRRDKTGKAAKDIIDRVRKELAPEYGVPLSAPAPAKPAEPKKDDKKGGGWGELKVK